MQSINRAHTTASGTVSKLAQEASWQRDSHALAKACIGEGLGFFEMLDEHEQSKESHRHRQRFLPADWRSRYSGAARCTGDMEPHAGTAFRGVPILRRLHSLRH